MRFANAIVKRPGAMTARGAGLGRLGKPDSALIRQQHESYVRALRQCGLAVTVLDPSEDLPDSAFIGDAAITTLHCAVFANPRDEIRRSEPATVEAAIRKYYTNLSRIEAPGTLDGGDVLMAGTHFYIGLSRRTNREGASQLSGILKRHGFGVSCIEAEGTLPLQSSVSYLESNNLLATAAFAKRAEFAKFNIVEIAEEAYAAGSVWINGTVLLPAGFPKTEEAIRSAGYRTVALDISEFMKLNGGPNRLSLRF